MDQNKEKEKLETAEPVKVSPYKAEEFDLFIKNFSNFLALGSWEAVAKALGVTTETIRIWRMQPKAIEAKNKAMEKVLAGMLESGADDWRMWREAAKLIGMDDQQKLDVTSDGDKIEGLVIIKDTNGD